MTAAPAHPTVEASATRPTAIAWLRTVLGLAAVLVVAAGALRTIDAVPTLAMGVARGVRRVDSLAAIERYTTQRMPVPMYFPDTLGWPPSDLLVFGGSSASMWFRQRHSRETWLIVAMGVGQDRVAPEVLPSVTSLQTEPTSVRSVPGTVDRLRDADGVTWYQLVWRSPHATWLVRYRGTLDDAMLIANSLDQRGR
ncbi:MAG: hypothetical protein WCP29_06745 [Acidobacteriota bacterium]